MLAFDVASEGTPAMADQTRKPPRKHLMHYDPEVKGVWSGYRGDLNPLCDQYGHIMVTSVPEAVNCLPCGHKMEQSSA